MLQTLRRMLSFSKAPANQPLSDLPITHSSSKRKLSISSEDDIAPSLKKQKSETIEEASNTEPYVDASADADVSIPPAAAMDDEDHHPQAERNTEDNVPVFDARDVESTVVAVEVQIFPTISEATANTCYLQEKGVTAVLHGGSAVKSVIWLKSQLEAAYKDCSPGYDSKSRDAITRDNRVLDWTISSPPNTRKTASSKKLLSAWDASRQSLLLPVEDERWWEVTITRSEPPATRPRFKVLLQSFEFDSPANKDLATRGGSEDLGIWWLTALEPATEASAALINFHLELA